MDGNGRWATSRGLPRLAGHKRGAERVREIVESCPDLAITHLTLFAFSTENWKRPAAEVIGLMRLFRRYIKKEGARLVAEGVRVRFIGGRERLDADLQALMGGLEAQTARQRPAAPDGGDQLRRARRDPARDAAGGRGGAGRAAARRGHHAGDDRAASRHRRAAGPRPGGADLGRVPGLGLPAVADGLCRVRLRRDALARLHRRDVRGAGARVRAAASAASAPWRDDGRQAAAGPLRRPRAAAGVGAGAGGDRAAGPLGGRRLGGGLRRGRAGADALGVPPDGHRLRGAGGAVAGRAGGRRACSRSWRPPAGAPATGLGVPRGRRRRGGGGGAAVVGLADRRASST